MMAKCYLCGNETDEFVIIETFPNPEVALCFDCEEKLIQQGKDLNNLKEILFEGGETHGNKR